MYCPLPAVQRSQQAQRCRLQLTQGPRGSTARPGPSLASAGVPDGGAWKLQPGPRWHAHEGAVEGAFQASC